MAFSFVNYEGPTLPKDPGVRKMIRRQAMRDVAVDRRTRGRYGQANRQVNLRLYPVFVDSFVDIDDQTKMSKDKTKSEDASSQPGRAGRSGGHKRLALSSYSPRPSPLPISTPSSSSFSRRLSLPRSISYPDGATTERFALLLNLVPLTGLRLGIGKLSSVKSDLVRVRAGEPLSISASALGNPKLAHFIISRYGDVPALRYATDCVVDKLRQVLMRSRGGGSPLPHHGKDPTLLLYNQALRAVQAALEDDTLRLGEETLCATELLAAFEVLPACHYNIMLGNAYEL